MAQQDSDIQLIEVPYDSLSTAALKGIVESFILREGTDYGEHEFSLDQKVEQVLQQLRRKETIIIFDPKEESFDLRKPLKELKNI